MRTLELPSQVELFGKFSEKLQEFAGVTVDNDALNAKLGKFASDRSIASNFVSSLLPATAQGIINETSTGLLNYDIFGGPLVAYRIPGRKLPGQKEFSVQKTEATLFNTPEFALKIVNYFEPDLKRGAYDAPGDAFEFVVTGGFSANVKLRQNNGEVLSGRQTVNAGKLVEMPRGMYYRSIREVFLPCTTVLAFFRTNPKEDKNWGYYDSKTGGHIPASERPPSKQWLDQLSAWKAETNSLYGIS